MFDQFISIMVSMAIPIFGVGCAMTLIEARYQGEPQPWRAHLKGLFFWLFSYSIGLGLVALIESTILSMGITPLVRLNLVDAGQFLGPFSFLLTYLVFPIFYAMVTDLLFFIFHRCQHVFPFMWKFHAVHHSIRRLNALNSWHHLAEGFFEIVFLFVPLTFFVQINIAQAAIVGVILTSWGVFVHSNIKAHLGGLRYFLVEPQYHRIHHSQQAGHYNKNFAVVFPIWDIIAGTAYFPGRDEFPSTGLADQPEPETVRDYLLAPFART